MLSTDLPSHLWFEPTNTCNTPVTIRPIRPEDESLMVQLHKMLSEPSVYLRYFHLMKLNQRVAHDRQLERCQ